MDAENTKLLFKVRDHELNTNNTCLTTFLKIVRRQSHIAATDAPSPFRRSYILLLCFLFHVLLSLLVFSSASNDFRRKIKNKI